MARSSVLIASCHLTDYQKSIVLNSGEDIPTGSQKIPHYMAFDVKYDLRNKARLVAGGN
jgi:hypothetical protein